MRVRPPSGGAPSARYAHASACQRWDPMVSCQLSSSPHLARHCSQPGFTPGIGGSGPTAGDFVPDHNTGAVLPTRFHDAGNLTFQRKLAEADPAEHKLSDVAPRTSAVLAAVAVTNTQLGCLVLLRGGELFVPRNLCRSRHLPLSSELLSARLGPRTGKRHSHMPQQSQTLSIRPGRGLDGDIHALGLFDL